jgi:hypothetical protein
MINTKKLRIGNFVCTQNPMEIFVTCKDERLRKDVDVVLEVSDPLLVFNDGNFNSFGYSARFNSESVNPIPLTDEWFIRFGFEVEDVVNRSTYPFAYRIFTIKTKSKLCEEIKIAWNQNDYHFYSIVYFEYVHELQNFFFAITKDELKLNYNL